MLLKFTDASRRRILSRDRQGAGRMPGRIRLRLCFAALLTMLLMSPVRAEDVPGTLVVKVQDSSGAVIPGAAVRIEHAGEAPRELTADASGQALANPAPESYSIQVT